MASSTDTLHQQAQRENRKVGTAKKPTGEKRRAATDTLYILQHFDRQLLKVGVTGRGRQIRDGDGGP